MAKFPEVLLFDLGGVLIQSQGLQTLLSVTGDRGLGGDLCKARRKWEQTRAVGEFERGRISVADFCDGFMQEWQIAMTHKEFISLFNSFIGGFFPEAQVLLMKLKSTSAAVSCLSNTNILHWMKLQADVDIDRYFVRGLVSFEIGARKPEEAIYISAIEALGVNPCNIAFFDDALPNIEAANRLGMRAFHACGPRGVEAVLEKELGFCGRHRRRSAYLESGILPNYERQN